MFTDEKMAADERPQTDDPVTKFLFDLSFDEEAQDNGDVPVEEEPEPELPPPPPEPTFSEAELNDARAEAFREGQAAGLNEAGAGIEQRTATAMETVSAYLSVLGAQQEEANRQVIKDVVALNERILEMIIPAYLERHGVDEITALVADCLSKILDPGKVAVDVPAESVSALEKRLGEAAAQAGFTGALEIRPATNLAPGDVKLSWQNGGAERLSETIWAEISEAVERAMHSLDAADTAAPQDAAPDDPAAVDDAAPSPPAAETLQTDAPQSDAEPAELIEPGEDIVPRPGNASPDAPAEPGTG